MDSNMSQDCFIALKKGGFTWLRIPDKDVHGVRVAVATCGCVASKSLATDEIRRGVDTALANPREAK